MLGAPENKDLYPLAKNFLLMIITASARIISIEETITGLCKPEGIGHPNIICPIERYIRRIRSTAELIRRRTNIGDSLSFKDSSIDSALVVVERSMTLAPYPASTTAFIISSSLAEPSTPIELVRRLTEHDSIPSSFETAFSTRA